MRVKNEQKSNQNENLAIMIYTSHSYENRTSIILEHRSQNLRSKELIDELEGRQKNNKYNNPNEWLDRMKKEKRQDKPCFKSFLESRSL